MGRQRLLRRRQSRRRRVGRQGLRRHARRPPDRARRGDRQELWDVNTIDRTKPYTITGAPRVVKGKVLIGNGGAEFGVRGYVSAYDAETGELAWRFYTVPGNPADGFENAGAGDGRGDLERRVVEARRRRHRVGLDGLRSRARPALHRRRQRLAVESQAPQRRARATTCSSPRSSRSIPTTARTSGTTRRRRARRWDYTATQQIVLADLTIDGATRRVVMQAPKNGFFYVLDAEDRRADLGEDRSRRSAGPRTSTWRRAGRSRHRRRASIERGKPFTLAADRRTARTRGTRCRSARRRGSSTSRFTCRSSSSTTSPRSRRRALRTTLGVLRGSLAADPAVRQAAAQATPGAARAAG